MHYKLARQGYKILRNNWKMFGWLLMEHFHSPYNAYINNKPYYSIHSFQLFSKIFTEQSKDIQTFTCICRHWIQALLENQYQESFHKSIIDNQNRKPTDVRFSKCDILLTFQERLEAQYFTQVPGCVAINLQNNFFFFLILW